MDDHGTAQAQHAERFSQLFDEFTGVNAYDLGRSMRRIRERPKKIEDSAQAKLATRGLNVFHGGVHGGSEEKADTDLLEAGGEASGRQIDVHPESFHDVGRSALRSDTAIAMFGDTNAGTGDHNRRRRRDIEGSAGIATGSTGIDQSVTLGSADIHSGVLAKVQLGGGLADGFGKADDLFDSFAFHVKADQQRANLGIGAFAG